MHGVFYCNRQQVSCFSSDNVCVEIPNGVTYLGAGMCQYDPNREVDIGREHAFIIIDFWTLFIVRLSFIKIATFRRLDLVSVFR
jgi:hypothetical protein